MKINNQELSVNDAISFANFDNLIYKHRENNLLLNDYQIGVLEKNNIDYMNYDNLRELLFDIQNILSYNFDYELDSVSRDLSEVLYYKDTKK